MMRALDLRLAGHVGEILIELDGEHRRLVTWAIILRGLVELVRRLLCGYARVRYFYAYTYGVQKLHSSLSSISV